jgi:hypothetical protein
MVSINRISLMLLREVLIGAVWSSIGYDTELMAKISAASRYSTSRTRTTTTTVAYCFACSSGSSSEPEMFST